MTIRPLACDARTNRVCIRDGGGEDGYALAEIGGSKLSELGSAVKSNIDATWVSVSSERSHESCTPETWRVLSLL